MDYNLESGSSDYWDLDCILAEQQKVPSFFKDKVPGLGFLEGNLERDLHENSRVDIPFWLAQPLAMKGYIDMELPSCFGERIRNDLDASALSVNVKQLSSYFYQLGTYIVQLTGNTPELNLTDVLTNTLINRISAIIDHAETAKSSNRTDQSKFLLGLDETEKNIYKLAKGSMSTMDLWHTKRKSTVKLKKAHSLEHV